MSDLFLPRSGYANQRSPGALAAAIAINGGVIAALIAIPVTIDVIRGDPPLRIHEVPIAYVPPPPPKRTPPEQERKPTQRTTEQARPDPQDPLRIDTANGLDTGPQLTLTDYAKLDGFPGDTRQQADPPRQPALVKARPDPRYADAFRPAYPPAMRREGLEGTVTVRVTIDERGRVIAVTLVDATSPAFFEETQRQALRNWRFVPATRDGTPVRSEQTMTVRFQLEP
jgi:protein TonB